MSRPVSFAVLALGLVITVPLWWWLDGGIDAWAVGFILWQATPFAALAVLHGSGAFSTLGTVATAVAVAGLTVFGYVGIEGSDSSTAALGFIYFPIWWTLVVVAACLVDLAVRALQRRFHQRRALGTRRA